MPNTTLFNSVARTYAVRWLEDALAPMFPEPEMRMRVDWPLQVRAARVTTS